MNLLELKLLSYYYPIQPVIEIKNIKSGNSSDAKCIITADGKYILRKLKDTKQAIAEFKVSEALSALNISPTILLSNNQQPYINEKGSIYNLQTYIDSHKINNEEINFYNLGKTISHFHAETMKIEGIYEQHDRFSLEGMRNQLLEIESFNEWEIRTELMTLVEQCLQYKHEINCYIHGDLGKWNLLFNHQDMYIIDFGELRKGNNHFDVSAVISSTLEWSNGENKMIASLTEFRDGYNSNVDMFDWVVLKENLTLWFTRGIIALLISEGINEKTSNYAEVILDRLQILNNIIEKHFKR